MKGALVDIPKQDPIGSSIQIVLSRFYEYAFVAVALAAIAFTTFGALIWAGFSAEDFVPLAVLFKLSHGEFYLCARDYHLVGLIFHVVNSFLVYCLCQCLFDLLRVRKLANAVARNSGENGQRDACQSQKMVISLIVAIVFAVYPGHLAAIASIAARPALVGLTVYLLFLLYNLRDCNDTNTTLYYTISNIQISDRKLRIFAATMLMAPLSFGYCLLLPALWAALYILARRTQTLSNIAQSSFLIVAIALAFLTRQNVQTTIVATKMLDDLKNETINLIAGVPANTSVALLNLPAGKKGFANFSDAKQLRAMLSPPFSQPGLSQRVLWLDSNKTGKGSLDSTKGSIEFCKEFNDSSNESIDSSKELIDPRILKQIASSNGKYQFAAWNDATLNYSLLSASSSRSQVKPKALQVVSIGSFKKVLPSSQKTWSLSSAFANRDQGHDVHSIILPVSEGISPFDYDMLELSIIRNDDLGNAFADEAIGSDFSTRARAGEPSSGPSSDPSSDRSRDPSRDLTSALLSDQYAALSWSSQSFDEAEHGEPILFTVDRTRHRLSYRLPLANNKGWLISSRVCAIRVDLPAYMKDYAVKSAVLCKASAAEIAQATNRPVEHSAIASSKTGVVH